ncbi:MAG: glycosyltransferase [Elusimicrobiota bacterium]|nr:MAG: glycosyltransferase [Elusimicrobiota bacterium]
MSSRTALGRLKLFLLGRLRPRFVAVVPDLAAEARELLGGARIEVLPNGVNLDRFKPVSAAARAALRAKLGWTGTVFLYTGRLSWEKRLPWFAGLWEEASKGKESTLVLVGEGTERPRQAKILPPADDTAPLYAAADVFVLPSVSEGLSNSLLEAMSSGTAILASAVGEPKRRSSTGRRGFCSRRTTRKRPSST